MRHPRAQRDIALAVTAGGACLVTAGFKVPWPSEWIQVVLFMVGMGCAMFGGVYAGFAWAAARVETRLRGGEGLMGRWRIPVSAWPGFFALEAKMAAVPDPRLNEFGIKTAPRREIEVIVARGGVIVGDSVHPLPPHGLPQMLGAGLRREPDTPTCVELSLYHPPMPTRSGSTPAMRNVLRFPVGAGPAAERAAAEYVTWCHGGRGGQASFFHGKGDGSDPDDLSTCSSCGFETHRYVAACERCGARMLSRRWARRLGTVLVVLGGSLAVGLGYLLAQIGPMMLHPGRSYGGTRFTGNALQAFLVMALLGGLLAFGVATTLYGAWQIRSGRRNLRAASWMVGIVFAVVALGMGMAAVWG